MKQSTGEMVDSKASERPAHHDGSTQAKIKRLLYWLVALGAAFLLSNSLHLPQSAKVSFTAVETDPYPDTDLPLRPALEPWDISTSYPYPKRLSKNVTESTWTRIATHPSRNEIVYEILGDLYCMYTPSGALKGESVEEQIALPILTGIPYEKDAAFSPDGKELVFISDSGFGVDNIWSIPYTTCQDMSDRMAAGTARNDMVQHTNSTLRFFSSPAFHPTESKLIVTKWYMTIRPNGGAELWEVPLNREHSTKLPEHSGKRLLGRVLPRGWTVDKYNVNQIGPEQGRYFGAKGDGVVYAKNTVDLDGVNEYSKDVHKGVYSIFCYNTTTKATMKLVDALPGGANMPRVSHDGQTLAFVRRFKEKSVLAVQHISTGTLHYLWYELTWDLSLIMAPMGSYPSFDFSYDDSSIIIWSSGHIWQVPLKRDSLDERVLAGPPRKLPFTALVDIVLAETRFNEVDIRKTELADEVKMSAFRGLRPDYSGTSVLFEAAGVNYVQPVVQGRNASAPLPKTIPVLDEHSMYYGANWVGSSSKKVIQAKWSEVNLTSFEISDIETGKVVAVEGLPRGRYLSPTISAGSHPRIAFLRTGADYMLGDVQETAGAGIWVGTILLEKSRAIISDLSLVDRRENQDIKLAFWNEGSTLLAHQSASVTAFDIAKGVDTFDHYSAEVLQRGKTSMEMVITASESPDKSWVGMKDFQQIWLAPASSPDKAIWSKPSDAPPGLRQLSLDGGYDVFFSGDGKQIFWLLGPYLHHADIASLTGCADGDIASVKSCVNSFVSFQQITASYQTEVARLKRENRFVAVVNATIFPMAGERNETASITGGTVLVHDGVIVAVGTNVTFPKDTHIIDAQGGVVIPGFVDVHGHWGGFLSLYPSVSWELETFLGYGVTTIHNPSSKNVNGWAERHLVERGAMFGPRIFHTGDVLYGSTQPAVYTEINSLEDARQALLRIKIEGGDSAFSVKNYQLSPRSARQRLLLEAEKLDMLVYPEGGFNYDWCLTYVIDGMTSIEHPIPVPELFDDVLSLYAASETSYTQVSTMHYGGIFGKQWVWQTNYLPENRKLRHYLKHNHLDTLAEVKQAPWYSYQVWNTTRSTRKLAERGVRTNIGSHGEQPIGFLFHSEMQFLEAGGQSYYETLWAATLGGAHSLGLQAAVGSLEPGKLADLVIYPPTVTDLESWWKSSMDMDLVMRGGRVFSVAEGLVEQWPNEGKRMPKGRVNPESESFVF